jgi:hypothetical protein
MDTCEALKLLKTGEGLTAALMVLVRPEDAEPFKFVSYADTADAMRRALGGLKGALETIPDTRRLIAFCRNTGATCTASCRGHVLFLWGATEGACCMWDDEDTTLDVVELLRRMTGEFIEVLATRSKPLSICSNILTHELTVM